MNNTKTGLEIISLYQDYKEKICEMEDVINGLKDYGFSRSVLEDKLGKLRIEIKTLEDTRFQPLDPVVIPTSLLGGKQIQNMQ